MGSAEEEIDVSGRSAKDTIDTVFKVWGSGGYATGGAAAIAKDFGADCVTNAKGTGYEFKNTDGYKVYNGLDGVKEWLDFLLGFDFPDFAVDEMKDGEVEGTVAVTVSYTPYVKATMKNSDKKLSDTQLWTVKDGKVASVDFTWGDAEAVDKLFAMTDNEKVVAGCFGAWGQGKFNADGREEVFTSMMSPDVVGNCNAGGYEFKNTTAYKTYEGQAGFFEWIDFLAAELDFPDFTVKNCVEQADGTVALTMSATTGNKKTGKKEDGPTANDTVWTITDGKVTAWSMTWSKPEALDGLFAA